MENFTPISALVGGLLIGLAAAGLLALNGRITGVSGITAGLVSRLSQAPGGRRWRAAFLIGLMAGTGAYAAVSGTFALPRQGFAPWLLVVSGLLVGYGTSLAGGCTSGHGVCGLARLSVRSLVATVVFLGVGIATTFVTRHLLGLAS